MILRHGFDHYLEVVGLGSAIIIVAGLGLIILAATLLDVLRYTKPENIGEALAAVVDAEKIGVGWIRATTLRKYRACAADFLRRRASLPSHLEIRHRLLTARRVGCALLCAVVYI